MKMVLASRNRKKIGELRTILGKLIPDTEILSLDDVGITEDIEENGSTFGENAMLKAAAAAKSGYIGIGDDSGLCVEALDGAPGVYSARYAGGHGNDEENLQLLLRNMEGKKNRRAAFVCAFACVFPDGSAPILTEGRCEGEILTAKDGDGGFGYDPVFWYPPFGMSFGKTAPEKKNEVSHRAKALAKFAEALKARLESRQE